MTQTAHIQTVADVERAAELLDEVSPKEAIEGLLRRPVEACSEYFGKIVAAPFHAFAAAVGTAFNDHRPLVLSPDMFWLLIAQGVARHVNNQPEEMRGKFVSHEGKERIDVRRDDFIKGSPENPWGEVFQEFSAQIRRHVGAENHSNLLAAFSTTGPIERAANEVVLMDTVQSYFEYHFHTLCGIPEVTLEGEPSDWELLRRKTAAIGEAYELSWWTDRLLPMLERVAENAAGADDAELWNNFYNYQGGSGGPFITGWILDLFPYLQSGPSEVRNACLCGNQYRITSESLPGGLGKAPFIWHYLGREYSMEFAAGFIGYTQNAANFAVRPKIGWAVCETSRNLNQRRTI